MWKKEIGPSLDFVASCAELCPVSLSCHIPPSSRATVDSRYKEHWYNKIPI